MNPLVVQRFSYCFLLCIILMMLLSPTSHAEEIPDGREFYFGIPHYKKPTGEGARGVPIQLWVGSRVDNTVIVEAQAVGFTQTHKIKAGTVKIISIPEGLMNTDSEIKRPFGIRLTSVDPVTVTCYISYKVTGEAFPVRPVHALGKKYYAMSLWQDQTDEYKPGQILIVATKDNTKVTYTPTADTERVKAKQTGSVTLQKGETYLIRSKVQPAYNQDRNTDLTGSYIESDKPIAVFSGHTKGAYPAFSSTMLGTPANFMRNILIDQMPPVEMLGTEYVYTPLQYTNRPYNGQDANGEGDMIRFVATRDNTDLYVNRPDGSTPKLLKASMKKGEIYEIPTVKTAAVYTATEPVLMGQFGKSWRVSVVNPLVDLLGEDGASIGQKKEEVANPPRNGTGCMIIQTPRSQWASYAVFRSPEGMNNFVNITFRTEHTDSITFNKKYLRSVFGAKVQEIPGTPYSYIASINAAGEHVIEADSGSGAQFAAYVYGNFDATKNGFAYGYPTGVDFALPVEPNPITITDHTVCGNVSGKVEITHSGAEFAGLYEIQMDKSQSNNYVLTSTTGTAGLGSDEADFTLTVIDPTQDAHAVVIITDRTGYKITRTYNYIAENISAGQLTISFGAMLIGTESCKKLTLTNPTAKDITVQNVGLKDNRPEFTIEGQSFPATIPAGGSITIDVCSKGITAGTFKDSIYVALTCYNPILAEVNLTTGLAYLTIDAVDFGQIPINTEHSREIEIRNISDADFPITLTAVDWQDKDHFRTEGLLDQLPITLLKRGDRFTFTVYFTPTEEMHYGTRAEFTATTTTEDIYSYWTGQGIIPVSVQEEPTHQLRFLSIAPQPFTGSGSVRYSLASPAPVVISLYTILGERVLFADEGMRSAGEHSVTIDAAHLPPGVYLCRLDAGTQSSTQTLIIK